MPAVSRATEAEGGVIAPLDMVFGIGGVLVRQKGDPTSELMYITLLESHDDVMPPDGAAVSG